MRLPAITDPVLVLVVCAECGVVREVGERFCPQCTQSGFDRLLARLLGVDDEPVVERIREYTEPQSLRVDR